MASVHVLLVSLAMIVLSEHAPMNAMERAIVMMGNVNAKMALQVLIAPFRKIRVAAARSIVYAVA